MTLLALVLSQAWRDLTGTLLGCLPWLPSYFTVWGLLTSRPMSIRVSPREIGRVRNMSLSRLLKTPISSVLGRLLPPSSDHLIIRFERLLMRGKPRC